MGSAEKKGLSRRTFIKAGLAGSATALIAPPALADILRKMGKSEGSDLFRPVYRTLGRTGLKISVIIQFKTLTAISLTGISETEITHRCETSDASLGSVK